VAPSAKTPTSGRFIKFGGFLEGRTKHSNFP
jgi:hypothetical protein